MRKAIRIAILAGLSLLCAARPAAPPLHGIYRRDCAPYDGPAFMITLLAPAQNGEFWLRANAPLAQIAGHWPNAPESRPGTASIVLCRKTPEMKCDHATTGAFTVTGNPGARISGSFTARFTGGISQTWRFTAMPAPDAVELPCG